MNLVASVFPYKNVDIFRKHILVSRIDVEARVKIQEIAEVMVVVDSCVYLHDECWFTYENIAMRLDGLVKKFDRLFDEVSQFRCPGL